MARRKLLLTFWSPRFKPPYPLVADLQTWCSRNHPCSCNDRKGGKCRCGPPCCKDCGKERSCDDFRCPSVQSLVFEMPPQLFCFDLGDGRARVRQHLVLPSVGPPPTRKHSLAVESLSLLQIGRSRGWRYVRHSGALHAQLGGPICAALELTKS